MKAKKKKWVDISLFKKMIEKDSLPMSYNPLMPSCGVSDFEFNQEINNSEISCGIDQLSWVSDILAFHDFVCVVAQVKERFENGTGFACLIFSDVYHANSGGDLLAKYINKYGLGEAKKVKRFINPNTDNSIVLWAWFISTRRIKAFVRASKLVYENYK